VPGTLTVQINPEDLPEKDPHEPVTKKQYVYMVAKSAALGFQEESVVLVSHRSGFVFIQTDKPIYNPEQEVKIRILPLDHRMKPSDTLLRMEILNPQGVIVERRDDITSDTGIKVELFRFPLFPMFGFWSVVVSYGPEHMLNSSVQFEVKEYVLPTYSLEIKPQKHILPQSRSVIGTVEANYVYGKPVSGNLYMKFGVDQGDGKMEIIRTLQSWINEGTAFFELPVEAFVTSLGENWFEDSEGKRLFIEASVTEDGTGLIENMTDNTAVFARSPYKFTFDQTVKYFKPGLPYELKLVVTHVNNQPAHDIPIEIRAQAVSDGGVNIDLLNEGDPARHAISNEYGEVYYRIDVPRDAKTVRITARTNKGDILPEQNKEELFTAQPYESSSGGYLLVRAQGAPFFVRSNINAEALVTQELEISKINYY
ncbi:venom factor-like, partial [Saccoglossus kowalevskii]|uniref:Venom factor-like n=1 Tax=Saccoglossus kowalevskii TaxID=10224 RepID=A0ABM0MXE2_SACKO